MDEEGGEMDEEGDDPTCNPCVRRHASILWKVKGRKKKALAAEAIARACAPTAELGAEEVLALGQDAAATPAPGVSLGQPNPPQDAAITQEVGHPGGALHGVHEIDYVKGCEITDTRIQYHIAWVGFPDRFPDWWQQLELEQAISALSQPEPYRGKIVELEAAGGGTTQCLIVEVRAGVWQLHAAHGTELLLDAARCCLVPEQLQQAEAGQAAEGLVAWKLLLAEEASRTDRAIDWSSNPELAAIRDEWGDGSAYPTFPQARAVVLAMLEQSVVTQADSLESLQELCVWLRAPSKNVTMPRIHAEDLVGEWMHGSLIRDSLKLLSSIDSRDVRKLPKLK